MTRKALLPLGLLLAALPALLGSCSPQYETGLARGKQEYRTCVPCHGADGGGNRELRAPAIAGLPVWYLTTELHKFQDGIRGADPQDMEGARMRPMARTLYRPGDLEAVAAYVSSFPRVRQAFTITGGDTAVGHATYAICATCHGPDAGGNQALSAPPIGQEPDWYLIAQLQKFKDGWRGTNPADSTGGQMRAMAMTLADSSAMRDVVCYLRTLLK